MTQRYLDKQVKPQRVLIEHLFPDVRQTAGAVQVIASFAFNLVEAGVKISGCRLVRHSDGQMRTWVPPYARGLHLAPGLLEQVTVAAKAKCLRSSTLAPLVEPVVDVISGV